MAQGCFEGGDGWCLPEENLVLDGDFGGFDSRPLPTNKHACKSPTGLASPFTDAPINPGGKISISLSVLMKRKPRLII